jgi:predicted transcriptional regulator
VEGAVLALLVAEYPTPLTSAELVHELTGSPRDFAERDTVERAVRNLIAVGLLHRHDRFVWPTRAALRFAAVRR